MCHAYLDPALTEGLSSVYCAYCFTGKEGNANIQSKLSEWRGEAKADRSIPCV